MSEIKATKQREATTSTVITKAVSKEAMREYVLYALYGVLTTGVNFLTYFVLAKKLGISTVTSNVDATLVSIIFAYVTNKLYVFKSRQETFKDLVDEFSKFSCGRLATGVLDTIIVVLGVDYIKANEVMVKTLSCLIVIILNYAISKLLVFNNNGIKQTQLKRGQRHE